MAGFGLDRLDQFFFTIASYKYILQVVMVLLRTVQWPALVVSQEQMSDASPSTLPMRKITVNVFKKGERVVRAREIFPFPPPTNYHSKKPKAWQDAMALASSANGESV